MKVIFFISNLNSGGIENYLLRFLKLYHNKFDTIYVWCKNGASGGQLFDKYKAIDNVVIIQKHLGPFSICSYWKLYHFVKQKGIYTVCDFLDNFAAPVILTAKLARVKNCVVWYRNSAILFKTNFFKDIIFKTFQKIIERYATKILANSMAGFDFYFGREKWSNNSKYKVIYNGLDIKQFQEEARDLRKDLKIPNSAFVVGHVGRYIPAKNHEVLMKVAKEIIKKHDNVYFMFCGHNVKREISKLYLEVGLPSRILLFENRNDIPCFSNTLDCFLFPSLSEGQPNALIEAMIKGLPFLASDIPSIRETVPKESHKFLINPQDTEGFIRGVENLIGKRDGEPYKNIQSLAIKKYGENKNFGLFLNELK